MAPPVDMGDHVIAQIRSIRQTMERTGSFTAGPGWGDGGWRGGVGGAAGGPAELDAGVADGNGVGDGD